MSATNNWFVVIAFRLGSLTLLCLVPFCGAVPSSQQTQQSPGATRRIGAVKAIAGTAFTLSPDSGADITVTVEPTTRIVRIAPGEKDLKNSAPIELKDVQVGDRLLVGGKAADDNQSFAASSIVVMKRSDLEARHQHDLQDWQRRGVDGLAKAVDAAGGAVTITVRGKDVVIHTFGSTVIRRYAPNSVKFDDAKDSTLQEIHPGDQVRARGERSADGSELSTEEIVSGSFPLFAGTVSSVDASSSTLSVHDLSSRKNVTLKITQDSQLHHLSPEIAQGIAARLKGAAAGALLGGSGNGQIKREQTAPEASPSAGAPVGGMPTRRNGVGGRFGGALDLQQLLNHTPAVSLSDLHKGDAVVILSTDARDGPGTAIKLFSGVEPILQATPNAAQAMMLAPWSVAGPSGDLGGP